MIDVSINIPRAENEVSTTVVKCTESCAHILNGRCLCEFPRIVHAKVNRDPYLPPWLSQHFYCLSFKEKENVKEETMSDVKITYKPADKKAKVQEFLHKLPYLSMAVTSETMADQIDSIYNGKEEDGEISNVAIQHGDVRFEAWSFSPKQIRIRLSRDAPNTPGMLEYFSKQEMREFAQALLKMSEQM